MRQGEKRIEEKKTAKKGKGGSDALKLVNDSLTISFISKEWVCVYAASTITMQIARCLKLSISCDKNKITPKVVEKLKKKIVQLVFAFSGPNRCFYFPDHSRFNTVVA